MGTIDQERSALAALHLAAVAVAILFFSAIGAAVAALLVYVTYTAKLSILAPFF